MIVCACACTCPAMAWHPIQGVSGDRLQVSLWPWLGSGSAWMDGLIDYHALNSWKCLDICAIWQFSSGFLCLNVIQAKHKSLWFNFPYIWIVINVSAVDVSLMRKHPAHLMENNNTEQMQLEDDFTISNGPLATQGFQSPFCTTVIAFTVPSSGHLSENIFSLACLDCCDQICFDLMCSEEEQAAFFL